MRRILLVLFALAAALLAQSPQSYQKPAAGFDPHAIDHSVSACANFYQYACGIWRAENPIPADRARWGRFDALQQQNQLALQSILEAASVNTPQRTPIEQKIGDLYYACTDEKAIEQKGLAPIMPDIERIAALHEKGSLADLVVYLYLAGSEPFFNFTSEPDSKNATQMIAGIGQGGLGLPDRDYYFKADPQSAQLREKYVSHVRKIFGLLGSSPEDSKKKADAVMAVETALAKGSFDPVTLRDPAKTYHKLPVSDLTSLAPNFDWPHFFEGVGAPAIATLDVSEPPFVRAFESVVVESSVDDLKSYLTWRLVHDQSAVLPAEFVDEEFDFYGKILEGTKELRPRWKRCVDLVDNQLPDALGRKFVEKTLGDEGIRRTEQMVSQIEGALALDIRSLDWMTPQTKQQAEVKLHAVINKIGVKEKWLDYSSVKITRDDLYGDAEHANEYELHRQLAKIGKPVDKTEWQMSQPTVNAYYDPLENDINFPAGILQPPFWESKMDDAVNYGAIGAVIGHELTHGFDDQGRQYDAQGNLRDWWTPADAQAFELRADCFVKEYSSFTAVESVKVNGKLTLGENTADNGGVRLAYMALQQALGGKQPPKRDGYSAEQRFFLAWAQIWCENRTDEVARMRAEVDPHSPGEYRVNGVVSNMPEFQKAFGCPIGQPMVRRPACRVW